MPQAENRTRKRRGETTHSTAEKDQFFRYFNIKKISDQTGIQPDKIYNNLKQFYDSLTPEDKRVIVKLMSPKVIEFFSVMGYEVDIKKAAA